MSELPAYRSSPIGMSRNRPFKRPTGDSLPKHECGVKWCGKGVMLGALEDSAWIAGHNIGDKRLTQFCSLGCLGRWAAREELRS